MLLRSWLEKNAQDPVIEVPRGDHPVVLGRPVKRTGPDAKYPFQGLIDFQGIKIDVENKRGSYRTGRDKDGNEWRVLMHHHYGEIRDTRGTDGDKLDAYVGPNHDSSLVVVVHQCKPDTGEYDEDKVMLGFNSVEEAIGAYKNQYDKPGFYQEGKHKVMPIGAFWRWVHDRKNHGRKVASLWRDLPYWGVTGAASGALLGALTSPEGERMRGALSGGAAGGAVGVATPFALEATGRAAGNALKRLPQARRPAAEVLAFGAENAPAVAGVLAARLAHAKHQEKKVAEDTGATKMADTTLPDVLRPGLFRKQVYRPYISPAMRKGVALGALGLGTLGAATYAGKHIAAKMKKEKEESRGVLPNPTKSGLIGAGVGAGAGAGLGVLGSKHLRRTADFIGGQTRSSMNTIINIVEDMRANGHTNEQIRAFLERPGIRDHLKGARLGHTFEMAARKGRYVLPVVGAALGAAELGNLAHALAADKKKRVVQTAGVLERGTKTAYVLDPNAPHPSVVRNPGLTRAQRLALVEDYGKQKATEGATPAWKAVGAGALLGGTLFPAMIAPGVLLNPNSRRELLHLGAAGAGLGALAGASTLLADRKERKDWQKVIDEGPAALSSKASKHLSHLSNPPPGVLERWSMSRDLKAAKRYNAAKTASIKLALLSDYAKDFVGGVDPFGTWTSGLAQQAEQRGASDNTHRVRRAVATAGGVVGGATVVPAGIGGIIGGVKGFAQAGGGVRQRLSAAGTGAVEGATKPFRLLHSARQAEHMMADVAANGSRALTSAERAHLATVARHTPIGAVGSVAARGVSPMNTTPAEVLQMARDARATAQGHLTPTAARALAPHVSQARQTGTSQLLLGGGVGGLGAYVQYGKGRAAEQEFQQRAAAPMRKAAEHVDAPQTPQGVLTGLRAVLVHLLGLYQLYYFAHWTARGPGFYSDHELFTRLYESTQEEFDQVAERLVGHLGEQALDGVFTMAAAKNAHWVRMGGGNSATAALQAEQDTIGVLRAAYDLLGAHKSLTLGLDDLLMQISSTHESNVYLLRRRMIGDPPSLRASLPSTKSASKPFLEQDRPAKVKEIYSALKRDHPEMPAEMKARIASSHGSKHAGFADGLRRYVTVAAPGATGKAVGHVVGRKVHAAALSKARQSLAGHGTASELLANPVIQRMREKVPHNVTINIPDRSGGPLPWWDTAAPKVDPHFQFAGRGSPGQVHVEGDVHPAVLAHELGHAQGGIIPPGPARLAARVRHALSNRTSVGMGMASLGQSTVTGALHGAGVLSPGDVVQGTRAARNTALAGLLAHAPQLAEEGRASIRAVQAARAHGQGKEYAKRLLPAWGTYAAEALPALGQTAGAQISHSVAKRQLRRSASAAAEKAVGP